MKILILEIGRRENKKKYSGFSLLEIIVVISIISILGIIIGLSTNFINSSNENPSVEKKLILIQSEIDYLKKYSLAVKSPIKLILNNQNNIEIYNNKKSFQNCELTQNSGEVLIYPSGEVTKFNLSCNINNKLIEIKINSIGKIYFD